MGFENCEVRFGKKFSWEMGSVPPFRTLLVEYGQPIPFPSVFLDLL